MNEDKNTPAPTEQPYAAQPSGSTVEQQPIAQNFTMHVVEPVVSKPSKWRPLFIALGIAQAAMAALYLLFTSSTILLAMGGISGIAVGLAIILVSPIIVILALINAVGLPIYLFRNKVKGTGLVLGIVSLVISAVIIFSGARMAYAAVTYNISGVTGAKEAMNQLSEERDQLLLADATYNEISEEEAIELIEMCYIKGFYYTNQTNKTNGMSGELSKTGIVLATRYTDGEPFRISIASWREAKLVPIARESQKMCSDLNIWHDGEYEPLKAS